MPKRKRRQEVRNGDGEHHDIPPRRKSAQLQERSNHEAATKKDPSLLQTYKLPSPPTTTLPELGASHNKAKLDENAVQDTHQIDADPDAQYNPIEHWVRRGTWPSKLIGKDHKMSESQSSSSKPNKRSRSPNKRSRSRSSSYSQEYRDGGVPKAYSKEYESQTLLTVHVYMDIAAGEPFISRDSVNKCNDLQRVVYKSVKSHTIPDGDIRAALILHQNRKEGIVNRDITPLVVPRIPDLYFSGERYLEPCIDEVNCDWTRCKGLVGPQPRPDLAIGFRSQAFTEGERAKLEQYTAPDNATRFTDEMYFPFLMCEAKCGHGSLDNADRQNMHSCSAALKALCKLQEKADTSPTKQQLRALSGKVLVYSVSHDQKDVRIYGHFANIPEDGPWSYHRHSIRSLNILNNKDDHLHVYNIVRNILRTHVPYLQSWLKQTLAAIPEPTTLPLDHPTVDDEGFRSNSSRLNDGFKVPELSNTSSDQRAIAKLNQQLVDIAQQMQRERQEHKAEMERQMKQNQGQMKQNQELMDILKQHLSK